MRIKLAPWYHLERKSPSYCKVMLAAEICKSQNLGDLKE